MPTEPPEPPVLLERFEIFRHVADLDDAREKVSKAMRSHRLTFADRDRVLSTRLHSHRIQDTSVNFVDYGGDVRIVPGPLETFYVVQIPLSGRSEIRVGGERFIVGHGRASVISPMDHLEMRWSRDCRKLIFRIEQTALEARLGEMLGESLHGSLRFRPLMDLRSGHAMSWHNALRLMVDELDRPGALIEVPGRAEQFEHELMAMLLHVHPHNYTDMLRRSETLKDRVRKPAYPRHVRDALQIINDHPEWDHTTASLAAYVGYSERRLQMGFQEFLGMGPHAYLRKMRLRRAHHELVAGSPESATVRAVAHRWRFYHEGHFADLYRKEFGERPSETLRRPPVRNWDRGVYPAA